ncbi:hypothetical protein [Nostoc punctiforme]|uniref:hypothetical protein n=1 Tax=Nostoc punctiforme TaxID=272131 RepID=UPI0005A0859A|nr:hypothetical protein [Nostoc punctiforme]
MSIDMKNRFIGELKIICMVKKHKVEYGEHAFITSIDYIFIQIVIDSYYSFNSASNDLYIHSDLDKKAIASI